MKQKLHIPEEYRFIIELGHALHKYGVPSYRIQEYLSEVARAQKLKGDFMDLPTWVNFVFYDNDDDEHNTYSYIRNTEPGGLDLGALTRSINITDNFLSKQLTVSEARRQLRQLNCQGSTYPVCMQIGTYGMTAASFSMIMGSNWMSVIVAFIVGVAVGVVAFFSQKSEYLNTAFESISVFVATILTGLFSLYYPQLNFTLIIISSIIVMVPGLSMTTALEEITSKSLVSGTSKLFSAVLSLFKQFFGGMLGLVVLQNLVNLPQYTPTTPIAEWITWLAIPLFCASLMPAFNVHRKDIIGGVIVGVISFSMTLAFKELGLMMSSFVGAIAVVISSKAMKKITKSPKLVYSTLGIIMLVPGSKAFLGLSSAFKFGTVAESAGQVSEQVIHILMGVIGGLIFSGVFKKTKG